MNSPITKQFGLDQIPTEFTGAVAGEIVTGPGVYLGRMSLIGLVPTPGSLDDDPSNYSF